MILKTLLDVGENEPAILVRNSAKGGSTLLKKKEAFLYLT